MEIRLPSLFSHGMVVGLRARVWGWVQPGAVVPVVWQGASYETVADAQGRFEIILESAEYGGPHVLRIGDRELTDVYIGRLWLCSGQSNMETPISRAKLVLAEHIYEDKRIRVFTAHKDAKFDGPAQDVAGQWRTATGNLDELFALPYFFARELLNTAPNIPVGLINVAAGGTAIECWLPEEIIAAHFPQAHQRLLPAQDPAFWEKANAEGAKRGAEMFKKRQEADQGIAGAWHTADFDHTSWDTRLLLDNTDLQRGVTWFRKAFTLGEGLPHMPCTLWLGRVVSSVTVWVNGQQVISVGYEYPPCVCPIPPGVLREGENTIAVRVVADGPAPQFVPGKKYALEWPQLTLPLDTSPWHYRVGCVMPRPEGPPGGAWPFAFPTGTYNHMLAPVLGVAIDGMLWYQGESNAGNAATYPELFGHLAAHVRQQCVSSLGTETFPIILAQLPNYMDGSPCGEAWAQFRQAQLQCRDTVPFCELAVTIDCGEYNDLHPLDKKTVAHRMALHACNLAYGEALPAHGPTATHATIEEDRLVVHFDHAAGLWAKHGRPLLDVLLPDGTLQRIYARVAGSTLVAPLGGIVPATVRFAYTDAPAVVLYNAQGLPASPFVVGVI